VSYELTILFTAFATIIGMFIVNGLPMHYHPVLKYDQIRRGLSAADGVRIDSLTAEVGCRGPGHTVPRSCSRVCRDVA